MLEVEELEKKVTGSDSVIVEEGRSFAWSGRRRREKSLEEMAAEEQTDSLDKDEAAIVIEIAVVERGVEKISYQVLEMYQRRNYYRRLLRLIKF